MWLSWNIALFLKLFLYKIFNLLQPFFKKDTILIYESCSEDNELINVTPLVEYCKANNIKCKFIYNYKNKSFSPIKGITVNCKNNKQFMLKAFLPLLKTHTFVHSIAFLDFQDEFFTQNKYIKYIFSDHGIWLLKDLKEMGHQNYMYNYCVTSNTTEDEIFKNSDFKETQLIKTGLFRFDKLEKIPHKNKNIFIMFTWRKSLNNKNYYSSTYNQKITEFLQNNSLKKILKDNNIKIYLALHPCMLNINNLQTYLKQIQNEYIKIIDTSQISKHIKKSDLLITDYSSIFFDFAYLNIPIIFYRFDYNYISKEDLKKEGIQQICEKDNYLYNIMYNEKDVIQKLEYYITNNFQLEKENTEKNSIFFNHIEKGKCCENFIKRIKKEK